MFSFVKSKTFLLHLVLATGVVFLLLMLIYYWLGAYTNHGETIRVPDIRGKKWMELEGALAEQQLRLKVADSSSFTLDKPGGLILEQDPAPGSTVKENRTIYISVSKIVPPQVRMPSIIDVSDRQAEAILLSYGLKTGVITYKPDLARNAVLEMSFKGNVLNPGDEVPKGSVIDLVLGDGLGNRDVKVPMLLSLTYEEAIFALRASSLTVGAVIYDGNIKDTLNAVVYKQMPEASAEILLKQGQEVDLYLRSN